MMMPRGEEGLRDAEPSCRYHQSNILQVYCPLDRDVAGWFNTTSRIGYCDRFKSNPVSEWT